MAILACLVTLTSTVSHSLFNLNLRSSSKIATVDIVVCPGTATVLSEVI